jgi:hypothetical protein
MDTNMAVRDASGAPQYIVRANPLGQQTEARMKPPIRIGIFDQHGDKQVSPAIVGFFDVGNNAAICIW